MLSLCTRYHILYAPPISHVRQSSTMSHEVINFVFAHALLAVVCSFSPARPPLHRYGRSHKGRCRLRRRAPAARQITTGALD